jgi:transposase-like protein
MAGQRGCIEAGRMEPSYERDVRDELVSAVKRGESTGVAARRLGVNPSTAYKWMQRSREAEAALPTRFVRLVRAPAKESALVVRIGATAIEVRSGFDATLLRAVIAALEEPA